MKNSYQKDPFIGLSHRGNSNDFIENSFEAFNSVIQMDYKYIETDLRMTKDGEIVTFHDESIYRVSGEHKNISDLTYEELKNILIDGITLDIILRDKNLEEKFFRESTKSPSVCVCRCNKQISSRHWRCK